jgi:peptidoglycan-N-acetylglucosamine deacetylase
MQPSDNSASFAPQEPRRVFYTRSPVRWKRFIWSMRLVIMFMILASIIVTITVFRREPVGLPRILSQNDAYRNILNPDHPAMAKTRTNLAFQQAKARTGSTATFEYGRRATKPPVHLRVQTSSIRAGFYVNWDPHESGQRA